MNILRPKDGDYIVRGIFLLLGWICTGWTLLTFLGGVIAGSGGALVGCFIGIGVGFYGYYRYLKLDPKVNSTNQEL